MVAQGTDGKAKGHELAFKEFTETKSAAKAPRRHGATVPPASGMSRNEGLEDPSGIQYI